ncbi:site-specific integrase [Actinospica durhamensis]|uniref:Site-specific integrase n=1 Tax=Actinospica durhamensis TaxID=1508375 RepID=A0A941IKT8_9ACTN|nr:site-specific integrase [Actinospica durhamensis]MBR7832215.1 site-specific integrase [Actinospica durhamensis]
MAHTKDHEYHALYNLIAHASLRRGEALALRWENIDFATGEITIEAQLVQLGWEVIETAPKTEASARTLVAPMPLLISLAIQRRRQHTWAEQAGKRWAPGPGNNSVYVFTDLDGRAIHPGDALTQFQRLTHEADLPPIRIHDLRHGAATMARAAGIDVRILSAMLGHSSTTITNDLYGDVATEAKREAANTIADQLAYREERRAESSTDMTTAKGWCAGR